MFKKEYIYHVVYSYKKEIFNGTGTITMYRNRKMNTVEDIQSVVDYIKEKDNYDNVLILNWKKLKR